MADLKTVTVNDVAYILPASEGSGLIVKRLGPIGLGVMVRWSTFSVGVDILKAGVLICIGPLFLFVAHIEKQLAEQPND